MSASSGNFKTLPELLKCMKASMLIPGITGELIRLKGSQAEGENIQKTWWKEYNGKSWFSSNITLGSEPLSDALIFEPIPYRSAIKDNCTHVLVLRYGFISELH